MCWRKDDEHVYVFSESNFKEDGFDSDGIMMMLGTQENLSYSLDLTSMRTTQLNNESLMSIVGRYIATSGKNNLK